MEVWWLVGWLFLKVSLSGSPFWGLDPARSRGVLTLLGKVDSGSFLVSGLSVEIVAAFFNLLFSVSIFLRNSVFSFSFCSSISAILLR